MENVFENETAKKLNELSEERKEKLKRLEELEYRLRTCKNILEAQMLQIPFANGDNGLYMIGLYNGMELIVSMMDDRKPMFCGVPTEDEAEGESLEEGVDSKNMRTISGFIKEEQI